VTEAEVLAFMPWVALPAMAIALGLSLLLVFVGIPNARRCVIEDHSHCGRKPVELIRSRQFMRLWRTAVAGCGLACLIWDAFGMTGFWPRIGMGVYLGLLTPMWFHLRWPAELQARLMQLEREQAQPWDVIV
jgi:hypothetical protein